jgi:hypothetical protein
MLIISAGIYAFGWSTLLVMYPPEVLNFSLRANGMSIYTFCSNGAACIVTFSFPFALEAIGWKTYMINASWDVLEVLFIIFVWVETSNKTLEEIDEAIEGQVHFDAPVLTAVMAGDYDIKPGSNNAFDEPDEFGKAEGAVDKKIIANVSAV